MNILLAAGGTGGHLFPALALGEAFTVAQHRVSYVGSGRPLDYHAEKLSHQTWCHLKAKQLKGVGPLAKLIGIFLLPGALVHALIILIQQKPDIVIGLGGYCTGPMVLMARFVGIKTAILEQNCIPGFTNRLLARIVHRIFIALPVLNKTWQRSKKLRLTGNPVRREVMNQFNDSSASSDRLTLLIVGGSQGAHFINEAMLELLPLIKTEAKSFKIIHLTGTNDHERIQKAYAEIPELVYEVHAFSDEMGRLYHAADLVLSRAGASTIADLVQFGKPAILIPYPFATDQHQHANARYLSDHGAALLVEQEEFRTQDFWKQLQNYVKNRQALELMGQKALALKPEDPAGAIVRECEELV